MSLSGILIICLVMFSVGFTAVAFLAMWALSPSTKEKEGRNES